MFEHSTKNYLSVDPAPVGMLRWLPAMVVLSVVVGFVALAWYAYHAGTQSVKDSDLLVVEADKTPIKEKPVDAGGMKFPDQDKTIFDTFAGNSKQPPKVERVLPVPEEQVTPPVAADTAETAGWINDKLHKKPDDAQSAAPTQPEQVIVPLDNTANKEQDVVVAMKKPMGAQTTTPERQMAQATIPPSEDQTSSYVAQAQKNNVVAPAPATKEEQTTPVAKETTTADASVQPIEEQKTPAEKENVAPAAPADDKGVIKVQLGAYRSEKEAQDAWDIMLKKHADLLADAQPSIVKADLGAKGIYYRLRVGKFSSSAEASVLCAKLVSAGQQCIIPTSK